MDRLTRFVTEDRPRPLDESIPQLVAVLAQLLQAITMKISQPDRNESSDKQMEELIASYIAIYYYAAQTNYWSQLFMPDVDRFDGTNEFHALTKRVVDGSHQDFQNIAHILGKVDQQRLDGNALAPLTWRNT
jgi:hypothetical protein